MRMRSGLTVVVLTLVGCGSSQASGTDQCGPASAKTVAANSTARIYTRNGSVYGCSTGTGRAFRLGSSSASLGQGRVGPTALAGSNAAYGLTSHGVDTGSAQVVVRRLTDGKVLRSAPAFSRTTGPESFQSVTAVVVKADGAVAWIGASHSISGAQGLEVHRIDSRGQAELDHGTGIGTRSLHLKRTRLTWLHSGRRRSSSLR